MSVIFFVISIITVSYFLDEIYSTYYNLFPEKLQEKIVENELKLKAMEDKEPSASDTKIYEIIDVLRTLQKLMPNETKYSEKINYYRRIKK